MSLQLRLDDAFFPRIKQHLLMFELLLERFSSLTISISPVSSSSTLSLFKTGCSLPSSLILAKNSVSHVSLNASSQTEISSSAPINSSTDSVLGGTDLLY